MTNKTLEELKSDYFFLQMKDVWDAEDYRYEDRLRQQIREKEEELKCKI